MNCGKMSGILAAGAFICLAYFSVYLGPIGFGNNRMLYFSPINWCDLCSLDWHNTGSLPSPVYAIVFLLVSIAALSIISIIMFCKKDLEIQEGEF